MWDGQEASMKHVFVYEYLSGGGLIPSAHDHSINDEAAAAELLPLGLSMRDALAQDLLQVEGVQLTVAMRSRCGRVPASRPSTSWRARPPCMT
jgi:hypothetical protein